MEGQKRHRSSAEDGRLCGCGTNSDSQNQCEFNNTSLRQPMQLQSDISSDQQTLTVVVLIQAGRPSPGPAEFDGHYITRQSWTTPAFRKMKQKPSAAFIVTEVPLILPRRSGALSKHPAKPMASQRTGRLPSRAYRGETGLFAAARFLKKMRTFATKPPICSVARYPKFARGEANCLNFAIRENSRRRFFSALWFLLRGFSTPA